MYAYILYLYSYTLYLLQCSDHINCLFSWQSLCPAKFGEVITHGEYKSISIMSGWTDWSYVYSPFQYDIRQSLQELDVVLVLLSSTFCSSSNKLGST